MKRDKKNLFYVSLLYRVSTVMLMFSMIIAEDIYKDFSVKEPYLIVLAVSSLVILFIYNQVHAYQDIVKIAVYIESGAMLLIYFLTGGLYSPVIWLVVNPAVFFMFYYRRTYYLQGLILLFSAATLLGPYFVDKGIGIDTIQYLPGLFLAIMMFVILSALSKQYDHNKNRKDTLKAIKKSLDEERKNNISLSESLFNAYSLVDRLLLIDNEKEGVDEIFAYSSKDKTSDGYFIVREGQESTYYSSDYVKGLVEGKDPNYIIETYDLEGDDYYGYFGVVFHKDREHEMLANTIQIELLVKLSTLFFDRNQFKDAYVKLLLKEEQRRIAEEMHDGVKQDIHGITYFIYNIINNSDNLDKEDIIENLKVIYESISETTHELKKTIYKLSDHQGNIPWVEQIETVCNRLKSQYDIELKLSYKNDVDTINIPVSIIEAIKRCLKESTANSVEHGKSTELDIVFSKENEHLKLVIINNGLPLNLKQESKGLGIKNMKKLAMIHKGHFSLNNMDEKGVRMELSFINEG